MTVVAIGAKIRYKPDGVDFFSPLPSLSFGGCQAQKKMNFHGKLCVSRDDDDALSLSLPFLLQTTEHTQKCLNFSA